MAISRNGVRHGWSFFGPEDVLRFQIGQGIQSGVPGCDGKIHAPLSVGLPKNRGVAAPRMLGLPSPSFLAAPRIGCSDENLGVGFLFSFLILPVDVLCPQTASAGPATQHRCVVSKHPSREVLISRNWFCS